MCARWAAQIRKGRPDFVVKAASKLCSRHFNPEDFMYTQKHIRLVKDAVPTVDMDLRWGKRLLNPSGKPHSFYVLL